MTITLTPDMEAMVNALMEKKQVGSAAEVLQLALDNLVAHQRSRAEEIAAFDEELGRRTDSLDRGEGISMEDFEARMAIKTAPWR